MNYKLYLMPFTKCTVQRRPFNFPDKKCDVQRILRESSPIWASEARGARTCEREWLRRGTICGEHNKLRHVCSDSFYALRSPEVPGWNWKFMSDRCKLSFLSQPPPPHPPPPSAFASPLARLFFTISRNGELACRLSATCRHIQYSDAIHTTKVTKDFLYLFICYGYVRLDPFPCINSLFWFQSVTVRDVNSLPFSLLIASPGNVVWKE